MVVSWSCSFSKHTVILTPLSQGYPAAQSTYCKDLPPVTATISCSLCLTFPWPKEATEEFSSCSSCWKCTFHLFFKYSYWTSLHGLTSTNFSLFQGRTWSLEICPKSNRKMASKLWALPTICCFVLLCFGGWLEWEYWKPNDFWLLAHGTTVSCSYVFIQ